MVAFHDDRPAVSAADVLAFARPTGAEARYGYDAGFIRDDDVVALMLARMTAGRSLDAAEEELALLLSDDLHRVREILPRITIEEALLPQHRRVWQYFVVRCILAANMNTAQDEVDDAVDSALAAFDYDDALLDLLPPPLSPGHPVETAAVRRSRQHLWVEVESIWYDSLGDR